MKIIAANNRANYNFTISNKIEADAVKVSIHRQVIHFFQRLEPEAQHLGPSDTQKREF